MSAIEAAPSVIGEQAAPQPSLQAYLGETVVLAAEPRTELFTRRWESGPPYDRVLHGESYFVSYSVIAEEGERRQEICVAAASDQLSLHRFTAATGLQWYNTEVWTVDFEA